jgi:hypothetical protein
MKKLYLISTITCLLFISASAQYNCAFINWEENATPTKNITWPADESAVFVLDNRVREIVIEKNDVYEIRTLHRRIKIIDAKGVELFNKISLPNIEANDYEVIKARTIKADGKVINFDKKDIKEIEEGEGKKSKIFAMEDVEKGAEVEYTFSYKKSLAEHGSETFQNGIPVLNAKFVHVSPATLVYEVKGYNGFGSGMESMIDEDKIRVNTAEQTNIPAARDEKYCVFDINLQRIEFKLSYLEKNRSTRVNTWQILANRLYEIYFQPEKNEVKAVAKVFKDLALPENEAEKISYLEEYLKTNYASNSEVDDKKVTELDWILKNKITTERGLVKLFIEFYKQAGINFQLVLTGNRISAVIDKDFENWSNAENFLFYFPSTKEYLAPNAMHVRYPYFEPYWGETNGLFCKPVTLGGKTNMVAEIKKIPLHGVADNQSNIESKAALNATLDTLIIQFKHITTGNNTVNDRPVFVFLSDEKDKQAFLQQQAEFGTGTKVNKNCKYENHQLTAINKNVPLIISGTGYNTSYVEKAGKKIIIAAGNLIGAQAQMYQERKRLFDIEIPFAHQFIRDLEITIPDGYTLKNINDLEFNVDLTENNEITASFISTAKIEGKIIKVHIVETYNKVFWPKALINEYVAVINAAADFNKVKLVFEKKG